MALRRARQGAHAGDQFWGCSTYPHCKAILHVGSDGDARADSPRHRGSDGKDGAWSPTAGRQDADANMFVLPREPRARALRRDHQVSFVECLTVPTGQLEHWLKLQDDDHAAPWSQFRLEYLSPRVPKILEHPDDRRVLSIVARLLLRGRVTRFAPELEEALQATQRNTPPAAVVRTCSPDPQCFDDYSEGRFFRRCSPVSLVRNGCPA